MAGDTVEPPEGQGPRRAARADFARQVHDALTHLYDPLHLRAHPLARGLGGAGVAGDRAAAGEHAGALLRRRLEDAIATLEAVPPASRPERARAARLLRLRYVEAQDLRDVQRELGISRAQFYRDQARAMEALTALLVEQGPWKVAPSPAPLDGDAPDRAGAPGAEVSDGARREVDGGGHRAAREREAAGAGRGGGTEAGWWGGWRALLMLSVAWGLAWFAVWTFAQTSTWPIAWAVGGVVSGVSTGLVLRLAAPAMSVRQAQLLTVGWIGAWTGAWLLGWAIARLIEWALRVELLSGFDPNDRAYAIARVAGWAVGGLITGAMVRAATRAGETRGWAVAAVVAIGWTAAGAIGHTLFWTLDPSLYLPGLRFAVSGLVEGAIGGGVTLWQLDRGARLAARV